MSFWVEYTLIGNRGGSTGPLQSLEQAREVAHQLLKSDSRTIVQIADELGIVSKHDDVVAWCKSRGASDRGGSTD